MAKQNHPYEISDDLWALLQPHLPGQAGQWGGIAKDNRTFLNAVFWVLRTGAPWRSLPPEYGRWGTVYQRFNRWQKSGVWGRVLQILAGQPGLEWLMMEIHPVENIPYATSLRPFR